MKLDELHRLLKDHENYSSEMDALEERLLAEVEDYSIFKKRPANEYESPLELAVRACSIPFLEALLKNGLKLPKSIKLLDNAMDYAGGAQRPLQVVGLFQRYKYKIDEKIATRLVQEISPAIQNRQTTDDFECIRYLVSIGADLNAAGERGKGYTPLMNTFWGMSPELTVTLLELGADPNAPNALGVTPLLVACGKPPGGGITICDNTERLAIVKILLEAGADPDYVLGKRQTAMYWAKRSRREEVVKVLTEYQKVKGHSSGRACG